MIMNMSLLIDQPFLNRCTIKHQPRITCMHVVMRGFNSARSDRRWEHDCMRGYRCEAYTTSRFDDCIGGEEPRFGPD